MDSLSKLNNGALHALINPNILQSTGGKTLCALRGVEEQKLTITTDAC